MLAGDCVVDVPIKNALFSSCNLALPLRELLPIVSTVQQLSEDPM